MPHLGRGDEREVPVIGAELRGSYFHVGHGSRIRPSQHIQDIYIQYIVSSIAVSVDSFAGTS